MSTKLMSCEFGKISARFVGFILEQLGVVLKCIQTIAYYEANMAICPMHQRERQLLTQREVIRGTPLAQELRVDY